MASLSLRLLFLLVVGVTCEPAPGRVPKVYNALITSNQNLEPSKAYPVYQPVLHDPFFPFQPIVYGADFPLSNGIFPAGALPPREPQPSTAALPAEAAPSTEAPPPPSQEPSTDAPEAKPSTPPPQPPNTQSPIPLNEFGLPAQVLPLGRFNPAYNGFTQLGPFTYSYPSIRFYDPYDPFSLSPYANIPSLYRPVTNLLRQPGPALSVRGSEASVTAPPPAPQAGSPPPEPSDLNLLNYSSKDPAIPNVPPPPLPQGGLKPDNSE